jgi:hypothetical protein
MAYKLLKYKHLVLVGILVGIFSFSMCHASAMPQNMDGMDCQAQTFCAACPVPVVSDSPDLSKFLAQFEILPERSPSFPDPFRESFYHPPR